MYLFFISYFTHKVNLFEFDSHLKLILLNFIHQLFNSDLFNIFYVQIENLFN